MSWQNRITRQADAAPDQLLANPWNWRIHPKHQHDALTALVESVGWVQRVIVNERTGHVIDGHLRVSLAIKRLEETIPVTYVNLTLAEEKLALATFDAITGLAQTDEAKLRQLLEGIDADGDVADALAALHPDAPEEQEASDEAPPEDEGTQGVLVTFSDEEAQSSGYDELVQMGFSVRVVNT